MIGIAIYSVEGTPLQQRELTIDQLRIQLERNGAFRDNIDKFVNDLLAAKCAEIRQHKLITQFFVGYANPRNNMNSEVLWQPHTF